MCAALLLTSLAHAVESGAPVPAGSLLAPVTHFEFAIYYPGPAPADAMARLQALRDRSPGAPALVARTPEKPTEAVLAARLDRTVQADYAPPDQAMLQRFGYGLTSADSQAIIRSPAALVLDFAHPTSRALPALRAASLLTEQLARDAHGFIWDESTREVLSPDAWHARRIASWSGDLPNVATETVVHAYDNGGSLRAISLGMGKYGLPDVVLPHFSGTLIAPLGDLMTLVVQAFVEGAQPVRAGQIDIDAHALRHAQVRTAMLATLKKDAPAARLGLVIGRPEDGDPANRLMEITPSRYAGTDDAQRLAALSHSLFDAEDELRMVKHTDELLAASQAARRHLPALREAFARRLPPGESIRVKAPFRTDGGGREWMWVEVETWKGDVIEGMLANEPDRIAKLHSGQHVVVSEAELFDYLHRFPDGHVEGNETDAIIERLDKARR